MVPETMAKTPLLRIGTRGSPLALAQAGWVRGLLAAAHKDLAEEGAVEIAVIKTTGDKVQDRPLAEIGGKGLFTKEIDEALLAGRVDLAVNSVKDVPTWLPGGIIMPCAPPREDPRDAWICRKSDTIGGLDPGSVVGTASLRRQALILGLRPDLKVVPLRGNVDTRLGKLDAGGVDATLLAMAGLNRLGKAHAATAALEPDDFLPAVGQGAVGVTCREADARVGDWLAPINHADTLVQITAERAMLEVLDGSCHTPIAALGQLGGGGLRLRGLVARTDGAEILKAERVGAPADAEAMGRDLGAELKGRAGPGFFADD